MTKLLIAEPPLQVLPSLATAIGLNEAIFLQQLHYWLLRATRERDGHKWVFKTYAEWVETDFPFWSTRTVRRIAARLEARGLIVTTDAYNRMPIDHTKWYTIDYAAMDALADTLASGQSVRAVTGRPDPGGQVGRPGGPESPAESGQGVRASNQRDETTPESTRPETTGRDGGGAVFAMYEDERFGRLTPLVADELGELVDGYGAGAVREALGIAVRQNKRSLAYVRGILRRKAGGADRRDGGRGGTDWRQYVEGPYAGDIETGPEPHP